MKDAVVVLHFGGNGHATGRLDRARSALESRPDVRLVDVPYRGFEGRPVSPTLDAWLGDLGNFCRSDRYDWAYASGIGSLVALSLRARGDLAVPLIVQGPVLWGLEGRIFPRIMRRSAWAREWLRRAFGVPAFQARFVRKYFRKPLVGPGRVEFFDGYARCEAFGPFFEWFTSAHLRSLERAFADHPERLDDVTVWLGGQDHVVGRGEVEATERALGVKWPVRVFPEWGHYPMIDEPEEWADALCDAVATALRLRRPKRPQAP